MMRTPEFHNSTAYRRDYGSIYFAATICPVAVHAESTQFEEPAFGCGHRQSLPVRAAQEGSDGNSAEWGVLIRCGLLRLSASRSGSEQ